jgi:uncharacterized protein YggE
MLRFLAVVALAQAVVPVRQRGPMPGFGPSAPSATSRGITVTGTANLRIPATSARVLLTITSADRKLTLDTASLQPVVDAIVKAGADPASVQLPPNFSAPGGSNVATLTATIAHPTLQQMQSGVISVGTVIAEQKDMVLQNAQVQVSAADCASAVDRARSGAVHQAREKAESLAKDLGVRVGGAINVNSFDQLAADGTCSFMYSINGFNNFSPQSPQTPSDYTTVPVTSNVTITYAIK